MCGIAGFVDIECSRQSAELEQIADAMADAVAHRGPDGAGVWSDETAGVALGHRRLAIIDLSDAGSQPMFSASGRLAIVFNGEIYNHPELRTELGSLGHKFKGTSDTEVLLEGVERFGLERALERAVGMFAFAVWDRDTRTLSLARDRFGEKPLYYGWSGRDFLFGSTLSALKRHPSWVGLIDLDVLALYFRNNYVPEPFAIYKGFRKLPPGSVLRLRFDSMTPGLLPEARSYWSLLDVVRNGTSRPFQGDDRAALERLEQLLDDAVRGQMIADVPIGAFLSGGIDSTSVVALMQRHSTTPVRTFTAGFEDIDYDESRRAGRIAKHLGTHHTELKITAGDMLAIVPKMPAFYDEPFGDSSQVPTSMIAALARGHVTVSLSGDGGDEVFCGYNRIARLLMLHERTMYIPSPIRRSLARLLDSVPTSAYEAVLRRGRFGVLGDQVQKLAAILSLDDIEEMYLQLTAHWADPLGFVIGARPLPSTLTDRSSWPGDVPPLLRLMWVEAATSLPGDMLAKVDRAGMASSLESRMPLLDHRILEFAWSLPDRFRTRDGETKWVLRRILRKHVPDQLVDMPKSGFGIPIDDWLRGPLRDWAESLLSSDRLRSQGLLEVGQVRDAWEEHLSGRRKSQAKLWGVLMFQAWLERESVSTANGTEVASYGSRRASNAR